MGVAFSPDVLHKCVVTQRFHACKWRFSGFPMFAQQDGSGTITIKEFEKGFHVETTKALFEALGLKAEDAWTLFRSLDKDG